jgi:hypothetical protein
MTYVGCEKESILMIATSDIRTITSSAARKTAYLQIDHTGKWLVHQGTNTLDWKAPGFASEGMDHS